MPIQHTAWHVNAFRCHPTTILSLQLMLGAASAQVIQDYEKNPEEVDLRDPSYLKKTSDCMPDIGRKVHLTSVLIMLHVWWANAYAVCNDSASCIGKHAGNHDTAHKRPLSLVCLARQ